MPSDSERAAALKAALVHADKIWHDSRSKDQKTRWLRRVLQKMADGGPHVKIPGGTQRVCPRWQAEYLRVCEPTRFTFMRTEDNKKLWVDVFDAEENPGRRHTKTSATAGVLREMPVNVPDKRVKAKRKAEAPPPPANEEDTENDRKVRPMVQKPCTPAAEPVPHPTGFRINPAPPSALLSIPSPALHPLEIPPWDDEAAVVRAASPSQIAEADAFFLNEDIERDMAVAAAIATAQRDIPVAEAEWKLEIPDMSAEQLQGVLKFYQFMIDKDHHHMDHLGERAGVFPDETSMGHLASAVRDVVVHNGGIQEVVDTAIHSCDQPYHEEFEPTSSESEGEIDDLQVAVNTFGRQ